MADSWQSAYFKQARADYEMFLLLEKNGDIPPCHRLHFLQMMTEKLAKGFKTPVGAKEEHPHTHAVFVSFLRKASSNPDFKQVREKLSKRQFDEQIKGLYPLAERIQRLAPDLAEASPNPEYPWKTPQGVIVAPIEFSFPEINLNTKDSQLIKLLKFIDLCFEIANRKLGDA